MTNTVLRRATPHYLYPDALKGMSSTATNQHIVRRMIAEKGVAFMGDIGGEAFDSSVDVLYPYSDAFVELPQKRFCVPKYDRLLVEMIQAWRHTKDATGFHAIRERIHNLGGVYLGLWEA